MMRSPLVLAALLLASAALAQAPAPPVAPVVPPVAAPVAPPIVVETLPPAAPPAVQTPAPPAPPVVQTPAPAAPALVQTPSTPATRGFAVELRTLGTTVSGIPVDEVELIAGPVVYRRIRGAPDDMIALLDRGLSELNAAAFQAGITAIGPPFAVFVEIDDQRFAADMMLPVATRPPAALPGLQLGSSPAGRAIRVRHVGSYESLEETYAEIETFVEDKVLDIRELFVERYMNTPRNSAPMDLQTEVFVLLR
jgi:effector-binding domain-containing protein